MLTEDKNADLRHAGMDCWHPGSQGCLRRHPCQLGFQRSMLEWVRLVFSEPTRSRRIEISF